MKNAVSFLLHPEALIGIRDFRGCVCPGGFHIVLPAHVELVHHHRVSERQAHAALVASGSKFAVGSLGQLDVIVGHGRPSC